MKPITQPSRTSLSGRSSAPASREGAKPRVSVVIPTYNRADLVLRAIESVLNQTFRDFELIVVDDASPDATPERVGAIADPRMRLVRLAKNGQQSHAENVGIATACGEWVAFLDDDDEWLPNKLELQLARLQAAPGMSGVYCRFLVQTAEGIRASNSPRELAQGDVTNNLLMRGMATTPSIFMVKRSALLEVGGFDEALPSLSDIDLWLRLSQASHRFVGANEPLVIYHAEQWDERISTDAVAQAVGFVKLAGRWGPLIAERAGVAYYEHWVHNREQRLRRAHKKLVRKLMRSGSRSEALRYVRNMRRALPWSRPYVAQALAVVAFGRLPYRLSKSLGRWRTGRS